METENLDSIEKIDIKEYQLFIFEGKLKSVIGSTHVPARTISVRDGNKNKTIQIFVDENTKSAYIVDFYYDKYKAQIDPLFNSKGRKINKDTSPFDAIVDDIINNGIQIDYLKVLRLDRSYIDLLQPDIYEAIKEDLEANKQMAVYLDYSKEKNCELLQNYDIYSVYWILKNCIYGSKEITELKWNKIRICIYIINKKQLSLGEWTYLTSILKHIENNPLYYELLYAVLYMDYSFVKSTFDKIYAADKSDLVERYLQELRPESFFNELLSRMKNSQDREERNRSAFNLLMYYPDKRKIIANEAVQLNDDGLLFEIEKVAEQETMPEVTEIVGKAIAQKQNLNNYPKYIICPNDGNRVQCLRTTKLRGKDGEKHIIPVYTCPICNRRYTVSSHWCDYEPVRVKSGFIINLLINPLEITSNRPTVIINPYLDNSILKKHVHKSNKKEFIKKKCIVCDNKKTVTKCVRCNDTKLVSGEFIQFANILKGVSIKMCPLCGLVYMPYKNYKGHEDILECFNKDELKRIATPTTTKKNEIIQKKTVLDKTTTSVKTEPLPNKSVVGFNKDDTKKQKKKISDVNSIQIRDFVVRRNVFRCMHMDHILENVNAAIDLINKDGKIIHTTVSAGYCRECNTYFIMESTFQNLKNRGTPICRISDEKAYLKGASSVNGMKLASESLLMQYGYNVSQLEGLTMTRRHKILAVLIDNNIMTKSEIISYLDFFINQRQSRHMFEKAIEKWNIDKEFVDEYKAGRYSTIGVRGIYRR